MNRKVKVLVLTGFGLNCDNETAYAFELAGAVAHKVHINSLIQREVKLDDYQIMVLGGGFSWGDDHGAGVIEAMRLRTNLGDQIIEFIDDGKLVLGICNGFQTLVNLGFLPGFDGDYKSRLVALTYNDCGNFRDQWVSLNINKSSPCVFTRGLEFMELPVRHGEGKFFCEKQTLKTLMAGNNVVLQYAGPDGSSAGGSFPENPNGSINDIAGICDSTGRVFGLMPHPEGFHHPTNHPDWTRRVEPAKRKRKKRFHDKPHGVLMFENAVKFFQ